MEYSYDYYYDYSGVNEGQIMEFMEEFGFAFLGVVLVIGLVALAVAIVMYVFKSIGLYTIANRRGIRNAWLAWIPVASYWVEGCISDQYQYVVKGKVKNKRKIMLSLAVISIVINGALQVVSNVALMNLFMTSAEDGTLASGAISMASTLVCSGLNLAVVVFHYMAMYDLYSSCSPQNNVLFLVLSIIFRITEPFFIFFNRKKDGGMPPRREAPQSHIPQEPQWQPPEEKQEAWNGPEV